MRQLKSVYILRLGSEILFIGSNVKVVVDALKEEVPGYYHAYIKSYSQYTRDFKKLKTLCVAIPDRQPYTISELPVYSKLLKI